MTEKYILKHKERPVLIFSLETERYIASEVNEIIERERLPFVLKEKDDMKICTALLNNWIEYRGITESRKDYEKYLINFNAENGRKLSVSSYGLNLTDQYWLHKNENNIKWKDINFFENKFDTLVEKRIYPSDRNDDTESIHPNFSVDGSLIKMWVYDGRDRVLIKEGRSASNQEPFNEVIASKIMDNLGIEHIKYSLKRINNRDVSICKCMVNKDTELLYAKYIFDKESYNYENKYQKFIGICNEEGISNVKEKIDGMIIIDFLIGNIDRHYRNFGVIRDANTLKWIKVAPLYDNGNSLFFESIIKKDVKSNIDSYCKWTGLTNMKILNNIDIPEWYDEGKLKKIPDIVNYGLRHNKLLSAETISKITEIIDERTKELKKIIAKKKVKKGNL